MAKKYDLLFSQAVEEYKFEMRALMRSEHTISDYDVTWRYFATFLEESGGDRHVREIGRRDVIDFMYEMATKVVTPRGMAPRPPRKRSKKTLRNYHTGLSALWTWLLSQNYVDEHVIRQVEAPKHTPKPVVPFTTDEIVALVAACEMSRRWSNKPLTKTTRPTGLRDQAIILTLLDTGVRNAELRAIVIDEVDFKNKRIKVQHGKGDKTRYVPIGHTTARTLRKYILHGRPVESEWHGNYLFVNVLRGKGRKMSSKVLTDLVKRLGERAGVADVYPHRFRHTAAIRRIQNGADAFTLKAILGHTCITTTMRYVNQAELDNAELLRRSSPVDNMRL